MTILGRFLPTTLVGALHTQAQKPDIQLVTVVGGENNWEDRVFGWPIAADKLDQAEVDVQIKWKSYRVPWTAVDHDIWSPLGPIHTWRWPQELVRQVEGQSYYDRGGMDVCIMRSLDLEVVRFGVAICAMADTYKQKFGRKIAFARARDAFMLDDTIVIEPICESKVIHNIIDTLVNFYTG